MPSQRPRVTAGEALQRILRQQQRIAGGERPARQSTWSVTSDNTVFEEVPILPEPMWTTPQSEAELELNRIAERIAARESEIADYEERERENGDDFQTEINDLVRSIDRLREQRLELEYQLGYRLTPPRRTRCQVTSYFDDFRINGLKTQIGCQAVSGGAAAFDVSLRTNRGSYTRRCLLLQIVGDGLVFTRRHINPHMSHGLRLARNRDEDLVILERKDEQSV